jgi:hypothetical protein
MRRKKFKSQLKHGRRKRGKPPKAKSKPRRTFSFDGSLFWMRLAAIDFRVLLGMLDANNKDFDKGK